jgi:hypothetical protein
MSLVRGAGAAEGKLLKTFNLSPPELAGMFPSKPKLSKRNMLVALGFNIYIIAIKFGIYKVDLVNNR